MYTGYDLFIKQAGSVLVKKEKTTRLEKIVGELVIENSSVHLEINKGFLHLLAKGIFYPTNSSQQTKDMIDLYFPYEDENQERRKEKTPQKDEIDDFPPLFSEFSFRIRYQEDMNQRYNNAVRALLESPRVAIRENVYNHQRKVESRKNFSVIRPQRVLLLHPVLGDLVQYQQKIITTYLNKENADVPERLPCYSMEF